MCYITLRAQPLALTLAPIVPPPRPLPTSTMSDSARPSTRSSKKRSPRRPRRSRKEVKRSKSDDDAEIKHVDPDHGKLNLRDETK